MTPLSSLTPAAKRSRKQAGTVCKSAKGLRLLRPCLLRQGLRAARAKRATGAKAPPAARGKSSLHPSTKVASPAPPGERANVVGMLLPAEPALSANSYQQHYPSGISAAELRSAELPWRDEFIRLELRFERMLNRLKEDF